MIVKALSITTLLFFVTSLSTYVLYLQKDKSLSLLTEQHNTLQRDFEALEKDRDGVVLSKEINDSITTKKDEVITTIKAQAQTSVEKVLNYPQKCVPTPQNEGEKNEKPYVDIDAPFDPEFLGLHKDSIDT